MTPFGNYLVEGDTIRIYAFKTGSTFFRIPRNAVGAYAFQDVLGWWRLRKKRLDDEKKQKANQHNWKGRLSAWRSRFDVAAFGERARLGLERKLRVSAEEKMVEADLGSIVEHGSVVTAGSLLTDGSQEEVEEEEDEEEDEKPKPAVVAFSCTIGKVPTARAQVKLDVFAAAKPRSGYVVSCHRSRRRSRRSRRQSSSSSS